MTLTDTDPIHSDWSETLLTGKPDGEVAATASAVSGRLARLEVADIGPALVPHLAAAAAELALVSGIPWRFSSDDPPVALLRLVAKATIACPDASGPHTARLLALLS